MNIVATVLDSTNSKGSRHGQSLHPQHLGSPRVITWCRMAWIKKRNLNRTQTHQIPEWTQDRPPRCRIYTRNDQWNWFHDSWTHSVRKKAIKRNQIMKRGEGVMKRFFGESGCYCYLMICLKCFQSLVGQNMIRITYRHGWKRTGLVLVKCHAIRLPGRAFYNLIWAG